MEWAELPPGQSNLGRLLETTDYSDFTLTIKSTGEVLKVHRCIISCLSNYFAVACGGGFVEAESKNIDLHDDNADMVKAMVKFFYTGDYCIDEEERFNSSIETHLGVYEVADKYDVPGLRSLVARTLANQLYGPDDFKDPFTGQPLYQNLPQCIEELLELAENICHISAAHPDELGKQLADTVVLFSNHIVCCDARKRRLSSILEQDHSLAVAVSIAALAADSCQECYNRSGWNFYRRQICGQCKECDAKDTILHPELLEHKPQ